MSNYNEELELIIKNLEERINTCEEEIKKLKDIDNLIHKIKERIECYAP